MKQRNLKESDCNDETQSKKYTPLVYLRITI